jgi:flagellar hook assembly protein FlgD
VARLYRNIRNLFNPRTTIRFDLARSGLVELAIFNVQGRLVRTLVHREYGVGEHQAIWDGTDSNGLPVASGIYHYRLRADGIIKTRSMALLQ